mmetsp:Transcript_8229/g.18379  ORF Transcript_8229/g.18379 Transcript_8229/m.18379 type:complete len:203 (+) Transcript_8229:475-1083(+)
MQRLHVVVLQQRTPAELQQRESKDDVHLQRHLFRRGERTLTTRCLEGRVVGGRHGAHLRLAELQRIPKALDTVGERWGRSDAGRRLSHDRFLRRRRAHHLGVYQPLLRLASDWQHQAAVTARASGATDERGQPGALLLFLLLLPLQHVLRHARLAQAQPDARLPVEEVQRRVEAGKCLLRPAAEQQLQCPIVLHLASAIAAE